MRKMRLLHFILSFFLVAGLNAQMEYQDFIYNGFGSGAKLSNTNAVTISPMGDHLYAASSDFDAISVYSRDAATGNLSFIELHQKGVNDVAGISDVRSIIVTADGKFVYAAGRSSDAVAVFSRDVTNGTLTFVASYSNEDAAVSGLDQVNRLSLSPDGKNLYATGGRDDALVVFNRDETTGMLTFLEKQQNGENGLTDMGEPIGVSVSNDGNFVYVASFEIGAVHVFSRDAATGALTFVEKQIETFENPLGIYGAFSLAISPDDNYVYFTGADDYAFAVFSRNSTDGKLTFEQSFYSGDGDTDGFEFATDISVSSDGKYIFLAGQDNNAVAVFTRNEVDTDVVLDFVDFYGDDVNGIDGLDRPSSLVLSPDGSNLYVAGSGDDALAIFKMNATTNELDFVMIEESGAPGVNGLRGVNATAMSIDGKHFYASGSSDNSIVAMVRDSATGLLTHVNTYYNNQNGISNIAGLRDITLSPNGKYLYAASFGQDAISVFKVDEMTGDLTFSSTYAQGWFGLMGLDGANTISLSPDGDYVYVTSTNTNSINIFKQNTVSDSLESVDVIFDGDDGVVDGLKRVSDILISKTGDYAYVTSSEDDGIAIFSRDVTTGELTYMKFIKDGINGVDGLDGAASISTSLDGQYFYVTSFAESAISVFSLGTGGDLDFVKVYKQGVDGVMGITGVRRGTMNPDGAHFYAAGEQDNSVAVFIVLPSTGELLFSKHLVDGDGDNNGMGGVYSVGVSPDGRFIYTAGAIDDAIGIYRNLYRLDLDEKICNGETYSVGSSVYNTSGFYIDTADAVIGSRTITNLTLTVTSFVTTDSMTWNDVTSVGSILVDVTGGDAPYTFSWDDSNAATTRDLVDVPEGTYKLAVTDANNCVDTFSFVLEQLMSSTTQLDITSFSAQLNPNRLTKGAYATLKFDNTENQQVNIEVIDQLGRVLRTERQVLTLGLNQFDFQAPQEAGFYFLKISTDQGKVKTLKFVTE